MKTIKEIDTAIAALESAMVDKGIVTPRAQLTIGSAKMNIHMDANAGTKAFNGSHYEVIFGDTAGECFQKSMDYIKALPSAHEGRVRTFQKNLANVIDEGNSLNMPGEVMGPLSEGMTALSDNLLTDQRGAG